MTPFSVRLVEYPGAANQVRKALSVFLLRPDIHADAIDGVLAAAINQGVQFDRINFVAHRDCLEQVETWLRSESSIRGRLDLAVVDIASSVRLISFDAQTGEHVVTCLDGQTAGDALDVQEVEKTYGLQALFTRNNGFMRPPQGFHYIKPSKSHVNGFLRTANVLEDHLAASIMAFWLLPHIWNRAIDQIVVDTSGISAVALTLSFQTILYGGLEKLPIISTHRSYEGLDHLEIDRPSETLFLISATTSGGLRRKLTEKGAEQEKIITLFYLGRKDQDVGYVLCDLTKKNAESYFGLDRIDNHNNDECPYCKQKSYPVPLIGDQFSFEPPTINEIEIQATDLPGPQQKLIDQLVGLDFFKVYRNLGDRNLEIYLDVPALVTTPDDDIKYPLSIDLLRHLRQRWKGLVLRGASVSTKRVVYANYPFSEEMAQSAEGILREHGITQTTMIPSGRPLRTSKPDPGTATLVIVACLDDSHELMGINRDLRSIQPHGNTSYVAPIFRACSKQERTRIKSNLTFGENGANTFSLYTVIEIDLPEEENDHSWIAEWRLLNEIEQWADATGLDIPQVLRSRISLLEGAPAKGLSDELFWPNCQGNQLEIRSDFTLLNTGGERRLSQADIFVVISAILHNLRQGIPTKPKLAYKTYERSVLSPNNFERFNDGIIQAALLRAARGYELAYANCDEVASHYMKSLLVSHIDKAQDGEGEALMEFLLAIATRRLTLHASHLREFVQCVQDNNYLGPQYHLLAKYIGAQQQFC